MTARSGSPRATRVVAAGLLATLPLTAQATQTGGVFGPVVNEGHRSAQYRVGHDLDNHGLAQRLHYQQALNDDLMWRFVAQARKTGESDVDFDFVQGELFWQLADLRPNWAHGLRFDLRLRDSGRPAQIGVNWMHQIEFADNWQARLLLLSVLQFGDDAASGVFLQTRASVGYAASDRYRLDLSMFSSYGSTADFAAFDQQSHQLGPTLTVQVNRRWQVQAGYLAGLTDGTPDNVVRLWLSRRY